MSNVENIKIGNTVYPIRDKNTLRSLSSAQEATLLANGTYNGEEVDNNTVFTMEDGTFQKFEKEHHLPGGSYINTNTTISPVAQSSALATAYNNTEMVVRAPSSDGYVEYSEDGGLSWQRSALIIGGDTYAFAVGTGISLSMCKGATSADVFIVRTGAHDYVSTCYHSADGGKTFVEKGDQQGDNNGIFLGYLKSAGKLLYIKEGFYNPYYSIDNGATWTKIDSWNYSNYGQLDDDTFILEYGSNVYTTQDLETFTQISSNGAGIAMSGTWFNRIRRCGDYLVCRGWNNGDKLAYSADNGVTWNWTDISTTHGACLDYDNGTYISFDASGYFYTSTDLLSGWEQSSFFSFSDGYNSTNAQPVVHAQNKFVFSSASGSAVVPSAAYDTYSLKDLSGVGTGDNAPQQSTEGYIGKLYVTDGGAVYICTGVSGSTYTWAQITVS